MRKRRRKAKRLFSIFLLSTSRACLWGRRRVIQYNGKVDVKKLDEKMRKEVKLHSFTGRRRRRLRTRRINKVRQDNFFLFFDAAAFRRQDEPTEFGRWLLTDVGRSSRVPSIRCLPINTTRQRLLTCQRLQTRSGRQLSNGTAFSFLRISSITRQSQTGIK